MKAFFPVKIDEHLYVVQVLCGDKLTTHYFKQDFQAFKFYNTFGV